MEDTAHCDTQTVLKQYKVQFRGGCLNLIVLEYCIDPLLPLECYHCIARI